MGIRRKVLLSCLITLAMTAQGQNNLSYYIEQALKNSPLLNELQNTKQKNSLELQRLKANYKGLRLQADGDFIFVPVVSNDNGKTTLQWNAPTPTKYYGYDTGQVSSELQAGFTLTKSLTGSTIYKAEQNRIHALDMAAENDIILNRHELERAVTDQYILCLLDIGQIDFIDSLKESVQLQYNIVKKMAEHGLAKSSDMQLLEIELLNYSNKGEDARKAYRAHLGDLNIICGIVDTTTARITDIEPELKPWHTGRESVFEQKYRIDSLTLKATLDSWKTQYKPQVSLFATGGMNTSDVNKSFRRFGASAGITFSWLLYDGKQKRNMERQTEFDLNTNSGYHDNFMKKREQMRIKYITQINDARHQAHTLERQVNEYSRLTENYMRELQRGDVSVTTCITVTRNRLQAVYDLLTLRTNIKLMINALNYWNW